MLAMGATLLGEFFTSVGPGDLGQALTLLQGDVVKRLPVQSERPFSLLRFVYGSGRRLPGQRGAEPARLEPPLARYRPLGAAGARGFAAARRVQCPRRIAGVWVTGRRLATLRRWIDTSLNSSEDIVPWQEAPPVVGQKYDVEARSVVVLWASTDGSDRSTVE